MTTLSGVRTLFLQLGFGLIAVSCAEEGAPESTAVRSDALLGANTFAPAADTYVPQLLPNQNLGSRKALVISNALIRFDQATLGAALLTGAAVTSARLEVTIDAALTLPLKGGSTIGAFRMTQGWTELGGG